MKVLTDMKALKEAFRLWHKLPEDTEVAIIPHAPKPIEPPNDPKKRITEIWSAEKPQPMSPKDKQEVEEQLRYEDNTPCVKNYENPISVDVDDIFEVWADLYDCAKASQKHVPDIDGLMYFHQNEDMDPEEFMAEIIDPLLHAGRIAVHNQVYNPVMKEVV